MIGRNDFSRARDRLDAALEIHRSHGAGRVWTDLVLEDRRRADEPETLAR